MEIKRLTPDAFKPFGDIIDFTEACNEDGWEIRITSQSPGWRIAMLAFDRKTATRLEYHPHSKETFEPKYGTLFLAVAPHDDPDAISVFHLDQPVCVDAGVWHEVFTLGPARLQFVENLEVECVYRDMKQPLTIGII